MQVEEVIDLGVGAVVARHAVAAAGPTKQAQCLVEQVRAQVVEQAAAGAGLLLEFLRV